MQIAVSFIHKKIRIMKLYPHILWKCFLYCSFNIKRDTFAKGEMLFQNAVILKLKLHAQAASLTIKLNFHFLI